MKKCGAWASARIEKERKEMGEGECEAGHVPST